MATFQCRVQYLDDTDPFSSTNFPEPTRPPTYTFLTNIPLSNQVAGVKRLLKAPHKLEDCALQLYKYNGGQGDYGTYLDLESSLEEQWDEMEGFNEQRKNTLILRTQLSVRVHACIEKLLNSTGRELRRALFSLKQIFQDDKDLVHEFVNSDGLECLIKVGSEADQNYQNYILRALGQVMLYVDGMNGVITHNETVQWLYTLTASKFRLVVKTALKLLLVFVEYTECNTRLLIQAVHTVDQHRGTKPWSNIMNILDEKDGGDSELLVYSMTLINKALNAIPEQDLFFDVVDCLEEQGMEKVVQRHMNRKGADLDLLEQFQVYETVLKAEDGEEDPALIPNLDNIRKTPRTKSEEESRKSRRHSSDKPNASPPLKNRMSASKTLPVTKESPEFQGEENIPPGNQSSWMQKPIKAQWKQRNYVDEPEEPPWGTSGTQNSESPDNDLEPITPGTNTSAQSAFVPKNNNRRRRRDRQQSLIKEQELLGKEVKSQPDVIPEVQRGNVNDCERVQNNEIHTVVCEPQSDTHVTVPSATYIANTDFSPSSEESGSTTSTITTLTRLKPNEGDNISLASTLSSVSTMSSLSTTSEGGPTDAFKRQSVSSLSDLEHLDDQGTQPLSRHHRRRRGHPEGYTDNEMEHRNNAINDSHRHGQDRANNNNMPGSMSSNKRWMMYKINKGSQEGSSPTDRNAPQSNRLSMEGDSLASRIDSLQQGSGDVKRTEVGLDNQGAVHSMSEKLASQREPEPTEAAGPSGDFSGLISRAKEGLSGSTRPPPSAALPPRPKTPEVKKTESDLQWETLEKYLNRPLRLRDIDFTDLTDYDDIDLLQKLMKMKQGPGGPGAPPPPPPVPGAPPPPPPPGVPPPPPGAGLPPPPPPGGLSPSGTLSKKKKTVRLHWKEAKADVALPTGRRIDTIWQRLAREMGSIKVDQDKLEHLFESRTSELKPKEPKQEGAKKEIVVLDPKRSNAINIGMTVLPPPRTIKNAILKMDSAIMNREGIEKILTTMLPSEEEKTLILEAQMANPDTPLGTAEQFLLTLSSISELNARLHLWAFRLDYDALEEEVSEPLNDLKQGIEHLQANKTLKYILATLLSVGNFLNGMEIKAFNIEYLAKVPEVKDTVHKHSLLHHLCNMVIDKFPGSTDLYSEIGPVARCAKVDWEELTNKLSKMEHDCKASWDHLRAIAKHDSSSALKSKLSEFLSDSAERIIIQKIIYRRVMNRFHRYLIYLGYTPYEAEEARVNEVCKIVSEFALEYRTTRDKVLQQREKKANNRERKKTRGKMIVETENFAKGPEKLARKKSEDKTDSDLQKILHNGYANEEQKSIAVSMPGARVRKRMSIDKGRPSLAPPQAPSDRGSESESVYDTGEDDILEACVRTAAAPSNRNPRERKRARNRERKSLRRTLKTGLSEEESRVLNNY